MEATLHAVQNEIQRLHASSPSPEVPVSLQRVDAKVLSPTAFAAKCMAMNQPIILTGVATDWHARQHWVDTQTGRPNFAYLRERYGDVTIQAAQVWHQHYSDQKRLPMKFAAYLSRWEAGELVGEENCLYCKDWHFSLVEEKKEMGKKEETASREKNRNNEKGGEVAGRPNNAPESNNRKESNENEEDKKNQCDCDGERCAPYQVPAHFSDDWLNYYLLSGNRNSGSNSSNSIRNSDIDSNSGSGDMHSSSSSSSSSMCDDYRFCYAGPIHSWTPLHRDVLGSYSWSTNICGSKLWLLFPPEVTPFLMDSRDTSVCVYNVLLPSASPSTTTPSSASSFTTSSTPSTSSSSSSSSASSSSASSSSCIDSLAFPHVARALAQCIRVIQAPGETIFVPSGWYHQVHNLGDVISINHNWLNGYTLERTWQVLSNEYQLIAAEMKAFSSSPFLSLDAFSSPLSGVSLEETAEIPTPTTEKQAVKEKKKVVEEKSEEWEKERERQNEKEREKERERAEAADEEKRLAQHLLLVHTGMNYDGFLLFLRCILQRLIAVHSPTSISTSILTSSPVPTSTSTLPSTSAAENVCEPLSVAPLTAEGRRDRGMYLQMVERKVQLIVEEIRRTSASSSSSIAGSLLVLDDNLTSLSTIATALLMV